jgi:hypothetical protein
LFRRSLLVAIELGWDGMSKVFGAPRDVEYPPTAAVVVGLNGVDPLHERFLILRIVTTFVSAPNVNKLMKGLLLAVHFLFMKSIREEKGT